MSVLSLAVRPAPDRAAARAINDFQSDTAEIIGAADPLVSRVAVWLLAAMVALAIGLSPFVPIERVVTGQGRVITQSPGMVVQPLEASVIRSIHVKEGERVAEGQLLATLDATFSAADVQQLERQIASLTAEIDRLEAEQNGSAFAPAGDGLFEQLQLSIWQSRQAELQASRANFAERIAATEAVIARAEQDAAHYRTRLGVVSEIEGMRRHLERNQYGTRLNTLIASDSRVEIARNLDSSDATVRGGKHELEALRSAREVFEQQWRAKVTEDLVARRVELSKATEEHAKATRRRDLVELRAVEPAIVLEVAHLSVGSVVRTGEPMFTLVPVNALLQVEADIAGADQGFVKPGDAVKIKLDAFRYMEHGTAQGVVRSISADAFTRGQDRSAAGSSFYRAYIDVTDLSLHDVPADFRLVPGMPLTAEIIVGTRSVFAYFMEVAFRSAAEGMREP